MCDSRCVMSNSSLLVSQETLPMTPWQNRVTDLTRRMADDMKVRGVKRWQEPNGTGTFVSRYVAK